MESQAAANDNGQGAADGEFPSPSVGEKGKGQAKDSNIIDRIQESSKLAFKTLTRNADPSELAANSKNASGSSRDVETSLYKSPTDSFSCGQNQRGPFRTSETVNAVVTPTDAFDTFTAESPMTLRSETPSSWLPGRLVANHEQVDGHGVIELLSRPVEADHMLCPLHENGPCAPEELNRLRKALFCSDDTNTVWEKLFDFTPDFFTHPEASREAALHLGITDSDTMRSLWFEQWHDVLSAYNSQVWGEIEPLVAEAKSEVNRLGARSPRFEGPPDMIALKRLRQILLHIRGGPSFED